MKMLPSLLSNTGDRLGYLVTAAEPGTVGTIDPFNDIYRIAHRLTMRTFGAKNILDSPKLLDRTLTLLEQIEAAESPMRSFSPGYLPWPISNANYWR